jgi:peroxiredoxin
MKLKNGHLLKDFRSKQNLQKHNIIIINSLKQIIIKAVIALNCQENVMMGVIAKLTV